MRSMRVVSVLAALLVVFSLMSGATAAPPEDAGNPFEYWTAERIASAQPRDLVIDHRGLGYLRSVDGSLTPYGHSERAIWTASALGSTASDRTVPLRGKPAADPSPPVVEVLSPSANEIVDLTHEFAASVSDSETGIKSVTFNIGGTSFTPACNGDLCTLTATAPGPGSYTWSVSATNGGSKGGLTTVVGPVPFEVGDGGTPPPPEPPPTGDVITNERWTGGGDVLYAAGRLLYEMPTNRRGNRWSAYVCSGTVVTDGDSGRSIILTAAHCVFDDVSKQFARNAIFIPNQDGTSGSGTDWTCGNDPIGCWEIDHGVVDAKWTTRTFPDNIPWDYAYYVVAGESLEDHPDVNPLSQSFSTLAIDGVMTHAMGYSYSDDPYFMYCSEQMEVLDAANYWMPNCDLSGGSSGGPWIHPLDISSGSGPVVSVNSWGYTSAPGMAGPKLAGTSAFDVFDLAQSAPLGPGSRGHIYSP